MYNNPISVIVVIDGSSVERVWGPLCGGVVGDACRQSGGTRGNLPATSCVQPQAW